MSYVPQTDIVSVQLMDLNNPWSFVGKPYSYYTDHRLAVGDVVTVETKLGSVLAKVVEIDIPAYRVQRFKSIMQEQKDDASKYIPVYFSYLTQLELFSAEQIGTLLLALLHHDRVYPRPVCG